MMPAPSRMALPSVWVVVENLFSANRKRRLFEADAACFFYQVVIPAILQLLLRIAAFTTWYVIKRLLMGASMSVPIAQAIGTCVCGIPPQAWSRMPAVTGSPILMAGCSPAEPPLRRMSGGRQRQGFW